MRQHDDDTCGDTSVKADLAPHGTYAENTEKETKKEDGEGTKSKEENRETENEVVTANRKKRKGERKSLSEIKNGKDERRFEMSISNALVGQKRSSIRRKRRILNIQRNKLWFVRTPNEIYFRKSVNSKIFKNNFSVTFFT